MSEEFCAELSKLLKHIQCSICLNLMVKPVVTQCLHRFCGECIARSIQSSGDNTHRCPLCNEKITKRALKDQLELTDVIIKCTNTIDVLKNDQNLSKLFHTVLNSLNDSMIAQNIDNNCNQNKENDESIVEQNISELESNRQKSMLSTTIDSISTEMNNIEELSETQNHSNNNFNDNCSVSVTSNGLINDNKLSNVSKMNTNLTSIQSKPSLELKSQDFILNRSSVSYGLQRMPKLNDNFDKIIGKSTKTWNPLNSNKKRKILNKPNKRCNILLEDETDVDSDAAQYAEDLVEAMSKSAINSISRNVNESTKRFKRIRNIESSDDEMSDKNVELKEDNRIVSENEFSDSSDDELMISIHSNNNKTKDSLNIISTDVSIQNDTNSVDSYNSGTQLLCSSPFSCGDSVGSV